MEPLALLFVLVNAAALFVLPRRWAALPLIVGACYMTRGQAIELGVASLTVVRILIIVGVVRVVIRREWQGARFNGLDGIMMAFGVWMIASVVFHPQPDAPFVLRVRDVYEAWGLYLLFRVFLQTLDDVEQLFRILAIAFVPIALAMVHEKLTGTNMFARFGGVPVFSTVRNGVIRAQGPFAHAILAGSIGGACVPLMAGLWFERRKLAVVGFLAAMAIVMASGSSGPILGAAFGLLVVGLWPLRHYTRHLRWAMIGMYIGLELLMNRPAYYIIADVDLTGGSTAWHRAELIHQSIEHFHEWWLVGTDYTRHWMPSGVPSSPNQSDITNHFLAMGVVGGMLLLLLFAALVFKSFWNVGATIQRHGSDRTAFAAWVVGGALGAHTMICLSVSYYDHSILFMYLAFAASAALTNAPVASAAADANTATVSSGPARPSRRRWVNMPGRTPAGVSALTASAPNRN